MELSTSITIDRPVAEMLVLARDLEAAGVDQIWVAEAYVWDAVSVLGALAASTARVRLASGIINIYSRTPALLAQTAVTLDELCGGRFELGLGSSGPQVIEGWHGLAFQQPITRTREVIEVCQLAWRRETVRYCGKTVCIPLDPAAGTGLGKPVKLINSPRRASIPVWLAALGAKNVELTAETAEGWLPTIFIPEKAEAIWGEALRAGRSRRPEDIGTLRVCAGAVVAPTESSDEAAVARDRARLGLAHYLGGARSQNFCVTVASLAGFAEAVAHVQDLYLADRRREAAAALPDELVESLTLCGPPSYVAERLAAYQAAGVTNFKISPASGDTVRIAEQLRELLPGG